MARSCCSPMVASLMAGVLVALAGCADTAFPIDLDLDGGPVGKAGTGGSSGGSRAGQSAGPSSGAGGSADTPGGAGGQPGTAPGTPGTQPAPAPVPGRGAGGVMPVGGTGSPTPVGGAGGSFQPPPPAGGRGGVSGFDGGAPPPMRCEARAACTQDCARTCSSGNRGGGRAMGSQRCICTNGRLECGDCTPFDAGAADAAPFCPEGTANGTVCTQANGYSCVAMSGGQRLQCLCIGNDLFRRWICSN